MRIESTGVRTGASVNGRCRRGTRRWLRFADCDSSVFVDFQRHKCHCARIAVLSMCLQVVGIVLTHIFLVFFAFFVLATALFCVVGEVDVAVLAQDCHCANGKRSEVTSGLSNDDDSNLFKTSQLCVDHPCIA